MSHTVEVLVLDLLEWLSRRDRSYEETMDAWRTSCPNLQVWEEASDRGLVSLEGRNGRVSVRVTPAGFDLLEKFRPNRSRVQRKPIPLAHAAVRGELEEDRRDDPEEGGISSQDRQTTSTDG